MHIGSNPATGVEIKRPAKMGARSRNERGWGKRMKEGGSEAAAGQRFDLGRMGECCPDWRGGSLATDDCEKILLKRKIARGSFLPGFTKKCGAT